jgi:hypothetical protein
MAVFLSGCIQDSIVIHVKPDGSGTIEETSLLSNSVLDIMESLGSTAGSEKQKDGQNNKNAAKGDSQKKEKKTRDDIIAKMVKDAEKRAAQFGATVKFISAKPVKTDTGSGYSAVYAFQDINRVRVNQNLSNKMDEQKTEKDNSPSKEEFLTFTFVKGSPSKLTIMLPAQKNAADGKSNVPDSSKAVEDKPSNRSGAQSSETMKNLFQDMKLKIALQFEGAIVNTNATFKDGSTVTLIDLDFGKIINNAILFKQLSAANPQSIGEMNALFKSIEGMKFETNNPVIVEFK